MDFPSHDGDAARRIAEFNWASTPLGPIGAWPEALKHTVALMLPSPVPLVLLWGEDGVMIYNDAYSRFAGGRDNGLLGSRVREGWDEVAEFNDHVMRVGLAGGTLSYRDQELMLHRNGRPERVWMNLDYSPVLGDDGRPSGVLAVVVETTEAHRARAALIESETKLRFLDDLGRALADCRDADEMLAITTRMTAEHLGLPNCAYADMDEDQDGFTIRGNWHAPGSPSIVGHYSLANFGKLAVQELSAGRPLIINDNLAELQPEEAKTFQDIGIAATICMPLVKQGRLTALMAIHDAQPRTWSEYELSVIREVTERSWAHVQRVGAEGALRESEAQFAALAQNMPNQVWTARADGSLDWLNDRTYEYSGTEPGSLHGEGWAQIVHPEDRALAGKRWASALKSGITYETEFRLRDAEGTYRWHLGRAVPLADEHGTITAWVGTNTEIEAQKRAEEASSQDRDRLWRISQDLMLVCDFDGVITAVNPSAERVLDWSEQDMIGKKLDDFLHPDDAERTALEVGNLAAGATTLASENRYRCRDGSYRLLAWTAVPDGGRIHGIARDMTEQREIEDALRQSQKMEAVGQLTGGIAHDFNNLLQGIMGSLDVVAARLSQGRTDDIIRWLEGAKTCAERAAALTHRLLAFSRRQPLDPRPVEVNPLIASTKDLLRRSLGEQIGLDLRLDEELWLTKCDPNQLESAILNLAINARDAMPDGGTLTIETCNASLDSQQAAQQREVKPGQYVCVCVTDTGTGMDKETLARAFEPFFTTKPLGQGTGLGLSMIYGFTRQSEGYTRIESEEGKGTTVKLYLPRHIGGERVEEISGGLEDAPGADAGEVVLVIEDERVVRGLIVEVLNELGYRAIEADDGPKGLEILESSRRIDLLITDIGLPGLNGREVAQAGREARPGLRVLFMTGYAENAAMASGFLGPGLALVTKPFTMEKLATRIREILEN